MNKTKIISALASTAIGLMGTASAQLTEIKVVNDSSVDLEIKRVDGGAGYFSPSPQDPLYAGLTDDLDHISAYDTVTAGRLEYRECDLYFSKYQDASTGAWSFTADAEDNIGWDGIDCEVTNAIKNTFTGEFSFELKFTD
ncbi:hypothetical protein [Parvularcula oceani]|uniref:hypothetical protein n=1 Tax=Parvularcula oceani TaxID=1247963 RepID=UPI0004E10C4D|nr:hypothetical protein [Parvularcula oceani]